MPNKFSIVIICKNAVEGIDRTLNSVRGLTDDIVVYDSGSTDGTVAFVTGMGVPVHEGPWLGFGPTRRAATRLARYDWVLCLDTDEWLGTQLVEILMALEPEPGTAYRLRLRNHLGKRVIRWGGWGKDFRIRLFHRDECNWNDALIHEKVVPNGPLLIETLRGSIIHRTARSLKDYRRKLDAYARLTAESYRAQGRTATLPKRLLSPLATFFKDYVLKLGFLEGKVGFQLAWAAAGYTRKKYKLLRRNP
ncbi:glycosyltransferase family 2 protein [Flaviaesturariibacter terrae]